MRDIFEKYNNFVINQDVKSHLLWGNKELIPNPLVTIIMPVYNHPDYFKQALLSAINQDYQDEYEIVVVDNNDMTEDITINQEIVENINCPKVLYYRNEKNIGMFGNFNRGVELARAKFITFLHDDDTFHNDALSTLMSIQRRTGCSGIFSTYLIINENNDILYDELPHFLKKENKYPMKPYFKFGLWDCFQGCVVPAGEGALFEKLNYIDIGGFNPEFYPSSDYALLASYIYYNSVIYQTKPIFDYRRAENESLSAYPKYFVTDRHVLSCIGKKLMVPYFIVSRVIEAKMNYQKLHLDVMWGHKDKDIEKQLNLVDRFWVYINSLLYRRLTIFKRHKLL